VSELASRLMSYQLPFGAAQPLKREMHWNLSTIYLPKQAYQGYLSREIKNYLAARCRLMQDDETKHLSRNPESDAYIDNHGENQLLAKYF
jgi:hypothetical protein